MISEDRQRQVDTTRERHGADFYKRIGKRSSGKGRTFLDVEKARAAANARWNKKRKLDEEEKASINDTD